MNIFPPLPPPPHYFMNDGKYLNMTEAIIYQVYYYKMYAILLFFFTFVDLSLMQCTCLSVHFELKVLNDLLKIFIKRKFMYYEICILKPKTKQKTVL